MIYSIQQGERHLATMEITRACARSGLPRLVQLEGPRNSKADPAIERAANGWLARRGPLPLSAESTCAQIPPHCSRWRAIWEPYCAAKPAFADRLMPPCMTVMVRLAVDLRDLRSWGEV